MMDAYLVGQQELFGGGLGEIYQNDSAKLIIATQTLVAMQ